MGRIGIVMEEVISSGRHIGYARLEGPVRAGMHRGMTEVGMLWLIPGRIIPVALAGGDAPGIRRPGVFTGLGFLQIESLDNIQAVRRRSGVLLHPLPDIVDETDAGTGVGYIWKGRKVTVGRCLRWFWPRIAGCPPGGGRRGRWRGDTEVGGALAFSLRQQQVQTVNLTRA
jgi:hypothetical protein